MVQMVSDSAQDSSDPQGPTAQPLEAQEQASTPEAGRSLELRTPTNLVLPELPNLPEKYHVLKALPEAQRLLLLEAILAHYENGASIYELASKLGVNNATLYRNLKKHKRDDWIDVTTARYEAEIESAEKDLKEAPDAIPVTRARERLAAARWKLERLDRRNYGQDQPVGSGNAVQININLRRDAITVENPE